MNSPVDRFKKRHAALKDKTFLNVGVNQSFPDIDIGDAAKSYISETLENRSESIALEANMLLKDIQRAINAEKFSALIDSCQENCLQTIIRPFGVGKVLFKDKLGGNVDTIHNARAGVYATNKEQEAYNQRGNYDSRAYHSDERYKATNYKISEAKENGTLIDAHTGQPIKEGENVNLDHVKSAKEYHDDAGRVLAELSGPELANLPSNLKPTTETINKSKKAKSVHDYLIYVQTKAIPNLQKEIAELESKDSLSDDEARKLAYKKAKLEKLESIDHEKMRASDKAAREEADKKINKAYYTSNKFIKNTISTSLNEGKKMAIQQAIGVLMEEFVRAAFAEVKDIWQNGFKGSVDDSFLAILKERLMRVAMRVQSKWRESASAGLSGAISGFISNIVTVMINIFTTTAKRVGRMLREGSMSIYGAFKILAFPKEGMTLAQAADAAFKLLAAGIVTSLGIELEMILQGYLTAIVPLAPFSTYISGIGAGLITGVTTAFVTYMIDYLDFFGVNAKSRHEQVVAKLDDMIAISYEQAAKSAALFIAPPSGA